MALHSGAQSFTGLCEEGKRKSREGNYQQAAELFLQAAGAAKNNNERIFALSSRGHALRVTGARERPPRVMRRHLPLTARRWSC